jgi:transposase-like protein
MSNEQEGKVRRRSGEEIKDILLRYRSSGLTTATFCRQQHLNLGTFHTWKKRYRENGLSAEGVNGFLKVRVSDPLPGLFAEVAGIRLYQPVSADYLKSLLP